ncbi:MAG: PSD1 and planctomycete cytochrome C domain-containing protein [Lentisphaeraceae bacterium]|nr:PSD1 and planctomycete cytochrome C domain-containing protein [Lentisphaeraceae bacterium]
MYKIIFSFLIFVSINLLAAPPLQFKRDILPIIERSCFKCHNGQEKKAKAGLRMDIAEEMLSFENFLIPGNPKKSIFIESISHPKGHDDLMPPEGKAEPISTAEIAKISLWIDQGAHFGTWEKYSNTKKKKLVSGLKQGQVAANQQQVVSDIDQIVTRTLAKSNLVLTKPASDETFLRRIYLQIIGRIPTLTEVDNFMGSNDKDKRSKLISKLQKSEGYVSHNFNYWANVLRVQTSQKGNIKGTWLEYLKQSLRENKSYDTWVREMLDARGSWWKSPQIGFYGRDMKNRLAGYEALTGVFLGTQIGCAQCHDHPFDATTRRDYFEMFGYTSNVHAQERRKKIFKHLDPNEIYKQTRKVEKSLKDKKPMYGNMTRSMNIHSQVNLRNIIFKVYSGKVMSYTNKLPDDYQYDDAKPKQHVKPDVLFGKTPKFDVKKDLPQTTFSEWVTNPDNLKFTHVIVNRLWHKATGDTIAGALTDLVEPERAKAPELLNYLSQLMVDLNYDIQKFNHILYSTEIYQSQAIKEDAITPKTLANGPLLKRMSAEQLWDSIMILKNPTLDETLAPKIFDFEFMFQLLEVKTYDEYWAMIKKKSKENPIDLGKGTRMNRMVAKEGFLKSDFKRSSELKQPTPAGHFLKHFGQADRELVEDQWLNPTVPQSLSLLNSKLVREVAIQGSPIDLYVSKLDNKGEQIKAIFKTVLSRTPTERESSLFNQGQQKLDITNICWILANTKQFIFIK